MTLQPSTANFSLINYSQEKDLNNLFAARKHQKNPENGFCREHYFEILYVSVARYLPDFTLFKIQKNEQSNKTSKLNSVAK